MSIYVLRYGDLLKIGYSSELARRVTAIMAAIPGDVEFVGHMPGDQELEAHLHQVFEGSRFSGEWFKETPELLTFCRTILNHDKPAPPERVIGARKSQAMQTSLAAKTALREYALLRWPSDNHRRRIAKLADELGWLPSRTFDFYHGSKTAVLRAAEAMQIEELGALDRTGTRGE